MPAMPAMTAAMPAVATAAPAAVQTSTYYGASGNELGLSTHRKPKVGLIIGSIVGAITFVGIALGVWLNWDHLAIIFDPKFAYYTVDSGSYGKFEMKFYKNAKVVKASELRMAKSSSSSSSSTSSGKDVSYIVQTDGKDDLQLAVGVGQEDSSLNCGNDSTTIVTTVNNKANQLCTLLKWPGTGKPFIQAMQFNQNDKNYAAVALLDFDLSSASTSREAAQALIDKYDLTSYKEDLRIILGSIRAIK